MAIYRGAGGSGDAINDSSSEALITIQARDAALAAQAAAEAAQAAAELAETNAETAETNAELAETNAETAETNAETAATNAASSASAASTSASNAASSASAASTSASNAATSATNASNSASAASTSATNAATSATNASNSASSASTSATNASNSASSASTSATNAANSATAAANSATAAAASATAAAGYVVPSQTGNAGKYLKTDGSATSWDALDISTADITGTLPIANGGTGATTDSGARTNLGLGSIATQAASSVTITGGSINGTTVGATTAASGKFTTLEATGVATLSAGTVSAPAITTSGDTNTGIFFPAADTIAFTEGGSEAMRIDSNNQLLIGFTGSTSYKLHVTKGAAGNIAQFTDGVAHSYTISTDASGVILDAPNNSYQAFKTNGSERMRITSAGNVGIGTSSPSYRLNITGNTNALRVDATNTATDVLASFAGRGVIGVDAPGVPNGRFILTDAGDVGIGTSSPEVALHNNGANGRFILSAGNAPSSGATTNKWRFALREVAEGDFNLQHFNGTSYDTDFYINSSGNIGIGTTSPARKLDVNGAIRLADANRLEWATGQYYIVGDTGGAMLFGANSAERMRIDSSGNVLVGTTSGFNTAANRGNISINGSTDSILSFGNGGSSSGYLYSYSTGLELTTVGSRNLVFQTSNTERMRITSGGNVGIGTSSPSSRLHVTQSDANNGTIKAESNTSNEYAGVTFFNGATTKNSGSRNYQLANNYSNFGNFDILSSTTSTGNPTTSRVTIDSSGNVGIGLTNPTSKLTISGDNAIKLFNTAQSAETTMIYADSGATFRINQFYSTGSNITFYTNPNGGGVAERMRIDSSGNVGIGTSSPETKLSVYGDSVNNVAGYIENNNAAGSVNSDKRLNLSMGGSSAFGITGWQNAGVVEGTSTGGLWLGAYNGAIKFGTGSSSRTERMRITSDGNLFLGATSSALNSTRFLSFVDSNASAITARCTNSSQGSDVILARADRNTTNNSFNAITYYNDGAGAYRFIVRDSGNALNTNGSYGTISDQKLKENIIDATPKLDKVNELKVRNFNLIGDELKQIGFVAQEFEQVFPSMVEESQDRTPDGKLLGTTTKTIKTTVLIPILVKAIQELNAKVEAQAAEIALLKSK